MTVVLNVVARQRDVVVCVSTENIFQNNCCSKTSSIPINRSGQELLINAMLAQQIPDECARIDKTSALWAVFERLHLRIERSYGAFNGRYQKILPISVDCDVVCSIKRGQNVQGPEKDSLRGACF